MRIADQPSMILYTAYKMEYQFLWELPANGRKETSLNKEKFTSTNDGFGRHQGRPDRDKTITQIRKDEDETIFKFSTGGEKP